MMCLVQTPALPPRLSAPISAELAAVVAGLLQVLGKPQHQSIKTRATKLPAGHHYSEMLVPVLGLKWGPKHTTPEGHF